MKHTTILFAPLLLWSLGLSLGCGGGEAAGGADASYETVAGPTDGDAFTNQDLAPTTHGLSGAVRIAGLGQAGVTITLSSSSEPGRDATTDSHGAYVFEDLPNGRYTLVATGAGQTWSPLFENPVHIDSRSLSGLDFKADGHRVSGRLAIGDAAWSQGATVILSGDQNRITDAEPNGEFAFSDVPNGHYTVTTLIPNQATIPSEAVVTVSGQDVDLEPFLIRTWTIAGHVRANSQGIAGVTLSLDGPLTDTTQTDATGAYAFDGLVNGTYVITPVLNATTFLPASMSVVVLSGERIADFEVTLPSAVQTLSAKAVEQTTARLEGRVTPGSLATMAWFQWGLDAALADPIATTPVLLDVNDEPHDWSAELTDLAPATTYYFRAVASNAQGLVHGEVLSLTTRVKDPARVVVNSMLDVADPPDGVTTLRKAIAAVADGGTVTFDPMLDGGVIRLGIVGNAHSVLMGEVYAGGPPTFQGYQERDYGPSALYAAKGLTIDASDLPHGIAIEWLGGESHPARVLAVLGDLNLRHVAIGGGFSDAIPLTEGTQPYTLARGGGIAVWGTATLDHCTIYHNRIRGDAVASRDRGAYGGGIYANGLVMHDTVVAGNVAEGYGAAGGGIYSVGGADHTDGKGNDTTLTRCAISGNRVTAQHAYGGGVFTLSGGPNNRALMTLTNCTLANNLVADHPDFPEAGQWYYRGGGIYLGGGSLEILASTVTGNAVNGTPAMFSGKPNAGGGGVGATIGNAHVVEDLRIMHSIVTGNTLNGESEDLFTGSILHFKSRGYNRLGHLDFSQILVPIPNMEGLSRKHYPKVGDLDGLTAAEVLDLPAASRHPFIGSQGTDAGQNVVLWLPPIHTARDLIPTNSYEVASVIGEYTGYGDLTDTFLNHVLQRLRTAYATELGSDFGLAFGDMTGTTFYGPSQTWPTNVQNAPWIAFWRALDVAIEDRLGTVGLGDDFWNDFPEGALDGVVTLNTWPLRAVGLTLQADDQRATARPFGTKGDAGAIEWRE